MKPILFTRENRDRTRTGHKTQTRRVLNPQPHAGIRRSPFVASGYEDGHGCEIRIPYTIGDILYLTEPYVIDAAEHTSKRQVIGKYLDDGQPFSVTLTSDEWDRFLARKQPYKPTSARFMYKSLARTCIQITDLRLQPIQEITEQDAIAEGIKEYIETLSPFQRARGALSTSYYAGHFQMLWDSINAARGHGWATNHTVLAITYQLTGGPIPSPQSPVPSSTHNKRLSDQ